MWKVFHWRFCVLFKIGLPLSYSILIQAGVSKNKSGAPMFRLIPRGSYTVIKYFQRFLLKFHVFAGLSKVMLPIIKTTSRLTLFPNSCNGTYWQKHWKMTQFPKWYLYTPVWIKNGIIHGFLLSVLPFAYSFFKKVNCCPVLTEFFSGLYNAH